MDGGDCSEIEDLLVFARSCCSVAVPCSIYQSMIYDLLVVQDDSE